MEFKVNSGVWGTMFGVPSIVADNFLKLATGDQIKVLLYLLRYSSRSVSAGELSAGTGVSAAEAEEAIIFWQQANVLAASEVPPGGSIAPPSLMQPAAPEVTASAPARTAPATVQAAAEETPQKPARQSPPMLAPSEIAKLMKDSADISELFTIAESALGTLNHSMQNVLITMYTHLGLKKEVILILLNYCISIDRKHPAYAEKIAYSWSELGINSLESAQEEVQRLSLSHDYTGKVMKAFEMKRNPTSGQQKILEQWREAGFSYELLRLAYERSVEKIDKLSFEYINKILLSWRDSGIMNAADVEKADSEYRRKKASGDGSSGAVNVDKYKALINDF